MAKDFYCTDTQPQVSTKYGKLHGIRFDGIYRFLGIKYADAKRFQSPTEPSSWTGLKDCFCYGYESPKMSEYPFGAYIYVPRVYWPTNENCQYLNVWTPSLDRNAKKAVMVWLHGGGYAVGSGNTKSTTEGTSPSQVRRCGCCYVESSSQLARLHRPLFFFRKI